MIKYNAKNRKRRIRKKLRVDEFTELCVKLKVIGLTANTDEHEFDNFIDIMEGILYPYKANTGWVMISNEKSSTFCFVGYEVLLGQHEIQKIVTTATDFTAYEIVVEDVDDANYPKDEE